MTQKEAVIKALETLGGKGTLNQIYPIAIKFIGGNTKSKTIKNNIRRELYSNPLIFKPTPGQKGWWELVSYQEEIEKRNKRIMELEEKVCQLEGVETKADFQRHAINKITDYYKYEIETLKDIRKLLLFLEWGETIADIDVLIANKEKPVTSIGSFYYNSREEYQGPKFQMNIEQFAVDNNGNMIKGNKEI